MIDKEPPQNVLFVNDVDDSDRRYSLSMTTRSFVALSTTLLENDDLVGQRLLLDHGADVRAGDERHAELRERRVADHEHFVELDRVTNVAVDALTAQQIAGRYFVLMTGNVHNCGSIAKQPN